MTRKSGKNLAPVVRVLDYRHGVEVSSLDGSMVTVVRGTHSLNTWTNKGKNGVTVRVDHTTTYRFENATITARS
jgi:hypothetical protein